MNEKLAMVFTIISNCDIDLSESKKPERIREIARF